MWVVVTHVAFFVKLVKVSSVYENTLYIEMVRYI